MSNGNGRSTGCKTCRRRHVKCDGARPVCLNCSKGNRICEGYAKELKFIDQTLKLTGQRGVEDDEDGPLPWALPFQSQRNSNLPMAGLQSQTSNPMPTFIEQDQFLGFNIQPGLAPFLPEISMAYLSCTLFNDEDGSSFQNHLRRSATAVTQSRISATGAAVQCLAITHYARMHGNDQKMLNEGSKAYGQAIRLLAEQVNNPNLPYNQEIMLATVALYFYELMVNTTEKGWVNHAGGVGELIELRGPYIHGFQPLHDYFLFCRRIIIMQALVTRKRTFLEREEWRTVPWSRHPHNKTAEHRIQDIMACIPGLMEDLDRLDRNGANSGDEFRSSDTEVLFRQVVCTKSQTCVKEALQWRYEWEASNPNVVTEADISLLNPMTTNLERPECLKTVYYFESVTLAEEIQAYNLTMIGILHVLRRLNAPSILSEVFNQIRPNTQLQRTNPLLLPYENLELEELARETMRCIDYLVLPQHPHRVMLRTTASLRGW
jgi:Zn(2)-Cys(6) binuclear cluster domain-containing protein/transcription factor-like protein